MMPLPVQYQKTVLYTSIVVGAFLLAFILQAVLPKTFAAASSALRGDVSQSSSKVVYLAASAMPKVPNTGASPAAELNVAENGFTHIGGARVTAVGNGTISASLTWRGSTLDWTIESGSATYYDASGEKMAENALKVGDVVSVSGSFAGSAPTPTIQAQYIRVQR